MATTTVTADLSYYDGEPEIIVQRGELAYERDPARESFMPWERLVLWNALAHIFNAEFEDLVSLRVTVEGIHARFKPQSDG